MSGSTLKRTFIVRRSIVPLDKSIERADLIHREQVETSQPSSKSRKGTRRMTKYTPEVVIEPPPGAEELALTICAAHDNRPDELLEIFHELQHELGYVPEQVLPAIANVLNRSRAEIYGVLTFYHEFRRSPGGRHNIKICRAEACQAMHTQNLCRHAEEKLRIKFGETTADGQFSLEAVYCLGNCALSPAMMIDGDLYGCVDKERFDNILSDLDRGGSA